MCPAQSGPAAGASPSEAGSGQTQQRLQARDIVVGKIASPFGVRGWTKVVSYTEPGNGLLNYPVWQLTRGKLRQSVEVEEGRQHGKFLVVKLKDIDDRDQIALLTNAEIVVAREQFPDTAEGDYYWADLIGLTVTTITGVELGVVDSMLETGANDVLVVKGDRERLVPWITPDVVTEVDIKNGILKVDWDPDF